METRLTTAPGDCCTLLNQAAFCQPCHCVRGRRAGASVLLGGARDRRDPDRTCPPRPAGTGADVWTADGSQVDSGGFLLTTVTPAPELCYDRVTAPVRLQCWERSGRLGWPKPLGDTAVSFTRDPFTAGKTNPPTKTNILGPKFPSSILKTSVWTPGLTGPALPASFPPIRCEGFAPNFEGEVKRSEVGAASWSSFLLPHLGIVWVYSMPEVKGHWYLSSD